MKQLIQDLFLERKNRIGLFTGTNDWASNIPFDCSEIINSVNSYIDYTCEIAQKSLLELPNITPNGLILPKKENIHKYIEVEQSVGKIFNLSNFTYVDRIHSPINIRIVKNQNSTRPKSSIKWHSDIWASEPSDALMIFIPIMGLENINILFREPDEKFYPDYVKEFYDYNECLNLCESSVDYNFELKPNYITVMDPFILHKTNPIIENSYRISIDFRFLPNVSCVSDIPMNTVRYKNYLSKEQWNLHNIHTEISIFDKFETTNGYAQEYSYE